MKTNREPMADSRVIVFEAIDRGMTSVVVELG
jgi:hypothetical protein